MLLATFCVLSLVIAVAICAAGGAFGSLAWLWVLPVSFLGGFLGLLVLAFLFLCLVCAFVKMDEPQEHDSKFFRRLAEVYVDALVVLLRVRLYTQGLEKTPEKGRLLLVCNHLNVADPAVLLACFRKSQLAFISKKENDRLFLAGKVLHRIMCQPLDRENDREALKTILKCIQLIKDDEVSIGVFPEGYVSKSGKLQPFRSGVFKIAQKAGVPIVVCTLRNTQNIFHNILRLKPTDVHLHLVAVIPPEELKGRTAVDIGEQVHKLMADDLGEEA